MPRHHHSLRRLPAAVGPASLGAAAAAFLLLCVFAVAACASHSGRWWFFRRRRCSEPAISNHQVQPGAEESIWQKSILMGGKCELPDFSGVVAYDSAGNLVVAGRPRPTMSLK